MSSDVVSEKQLKVMVAMETAQTSRCCSTARNEVTERIKVSSLFDTEAKEDDDGNDDVFVSSAQHENHALQIETIHLIGERENMTRLVRKPMPWRVRLARAVTRLGETLGSFLGINDDGECKQ